jgi:hypothetical protein
MYYSFNLIKSSKTKKKRKWGPEILRYFSVANNNPGRQSAPDHLFFALKRHDTHSNYKQFLGAHIS